MADVPHAGGRPAKYKNEDELKDAINQYFEGLKRESPIPDSPPTMSGLAIAIGYMDRQSLYDLEKRSDEFSCIIKKARLIIESYWESRLAGTAPTGAIFWLKNHSGYSDKTEITGENGGPVEVSLIKRVIVG